MDFLKVAPLIFHVDPEWKVVLAAAEREHRSIANMVAVLIMDHCERNGIPVEEIPAAEKTRTASRKKG